MPYTLERNNLLVAVSLILPPELQLILTDMVNEVKCTTIVLATASRSWSCDYRNHSRSENDENKAADVGGHLADGELQESLRHRAWLSWFK